MKIPFKIGAKEFLLEPYVTSQEKEILLLCSFGVFDFERVFEILNFEYVGELTDDEKKAILYQLRAISLGDEVDIKFICENCSQRNESVLDANGFIIDGARDDQEILKINKEVTDENLHEFLSNISIDEIDSMDILEFDELKEKVKQNQIKFNFIKETKCLKCGHPKKFNLGESKYIVEIMSDDSLMTLYKSYNFLIYFGHYSKTDIDNMLPFERGIFIGLLNKMKEDLSS